MLQMNGFWLICVVHALVLLANDVRPQAADANASDLLEEHLNASDRQQLNFNLWTKNMLYQNAEDKKKFKIKLTLSAGPSKLDRRKPPHQLYQKQIYYFVKEFRKLFIRINYLRRSLSKFGSVSSASLDNASKSIYSFLIKTQGMLEYNEIELTNADFQEMQMKFQNYTELVRAFDPNYQEMMFRVPFDKANQLEPLTDHMTNSLAVCQNKMKETKQVYEQEIRKWALNTFRDLNYAFGDKTMVARQCSNATYNHNYLNDFKLLVMEKLKQALGMYNIDIDTMVMDIDLRILKWISVPYSDLNLLIMKWKYLKQSADCVQRTVAEKEDGTQMKHVQSIQRTCRANIYKLQSYWREDRVWFVPHELKHEQNEQIKQTKQVLDKLNTAGCVDKVPVDMWLYSLMGRFKLYCKQESGLTSRTSDDCETGQQSIIRRLVNIKNKLNQAHTSEQLKVIIALINAENKSIRHFENMIKHMYTYNLSVARHPEHVNKRLEDDLEDLDPNVNFDNLASTVDVDNGEPNRPANKRRSHKRLGQQLKPRGTHMAGRPNASDFEYMDDAASCYRKYVHYVRLFIKSGKFENLISYMTSTQMSMFTEKRNHRFMSGFDPIFDLAKIRLRIMKRKMAKKVKNCDSVDDVNLQYYINVTTMHEMLVKLTNRIGFTMAAVRYYEDYWKKFKLYTLGIWKRPEPTEENAPQLLRQAHWDEEQPEEEDWEREPEDEPEPELELRGKSNKPPPINLETAKKYLKNMTQKVIMIRNKYQQVIAKLDKCVEKQDMVSHTSPVCAELKHGGQHHWKQFNLALQVWLSKLVKKYLDSSISRVVDEIIKNEHMRLHRYEQIVYLVGKTELDSHRTPTHGMRQPMSDKSKKRHPNKSHRQSNQTGQPGKLHLWNRPDQKRNQTKPGYQSVQQGRNIRYTGEELDFDL